jgi:hypothetical protein
MGRDVGLRPGAADARLATDVHHVVADTVLRVRLGESIDEHRVRIEATDLALELCLQRRDGVLDQRDDTYAGICLGRLERPPSRREWIELVLDAQALALQRQTTADPSASPTRSPVASNSQ